MIPVFAFSLPAACDVHVTCVPISMVILLALCAYAFVKVSPNQVAITIVSYTLRQQDRDKPQSAPC
jgi:hypothetical protein